MHSQIYFLPFHFLQVLEVNDLEEKVIHLWFCRSEALITRRQQDVEDMMEECSRLDGMNLHVLIMWIVDIGY